MRVIFHSFFVLAMLVPAWAEPVTKAIRVDQVGYQPDTAKLAMLVSSQNDPPRTFSLRRVSDDKEVLRGDWSEPTSDPDSEQWVRFADFTSVHEPGAYYLDTPEVGRSFSFTIGPDVFRRVYYLAARGFYGQRCGTEVDLGPDFPGYRHAVCHMSGEFHASSGKGGTHPSSHGWHDAGDYGRYVVNSGISTATLLYAAELFPKQVSSVGLRLPESGSHVPDLLNEARWNIEWMLSMQDSDGGVWHKQTSSRFCGFVMPEDDKLPSEVIGSGSEPYKTTCATADFAAVTALAARLYRSYDAGFAERCLRAAEAAWTWVEAHPGAIFRNPAGVTTGEYGDGNCSDEHFWAAAELARTTHGPTYGRYVRDHFREFLGDISANRPPDWGKVSALALWSYALGQGAEPDVAKAVRDRTLSAAEAIVARQSRHPYRISMLRQNYIWGSNGVTGNYSLQLLIANQFRADPRFLAAARENIHYLLGRNAVGLSFVTQVGSDPVMHIHHRPSGADHIDAPWPGLLSSGPNPGRQDREMQHLVPADTPPALAFVDVQGAYACNEIAINWQAPLVFSLAAMLP